MTQRSRWHDSTHGGVIHTPRVYHRLTGLLFLGRRDRVYRALAERSGAQTGQAVLDLGCGTGVLSRAMAERVGPSGSVLGIDPAPEMVEFATGISPPPCRYQVMRAEQLELPDHSIDVVVSALAVHHIPMQERGQAAAEAYRVLRPGGRVMLTDLRFPGFGPASGLVQLVTRHAAHDPAQEIPQLLQAAGFEQVSVSGGAGVLVSVTARRPSADEVSGPGPAGTAPVPEPEPSAGPAGSPDYD